MADLGDIVERIVGWAGDGEAVEAVAVNGRDTEIRVYEGDLEQLSSAEAQGVGIRVIRDGKSGYAWAGSLEESILRETLDDARDNASFAQPDEFNGLAEPDGVEPVDLDLYRQALADFPTPDKIDMAFELEKRTRALDQRITGIESASYSDSITESAIASTAGIRSEGRATTADIVVYALAQDGPDATRTGFGYSIGRSPDDLDVEAAARDAAERTTRMIGATKPASGRFTVVLDPWVTAQFLGIIGSTLSGEMVLKGRSLFADRVDDQVASPLLTLVDDPTDERALTAGRYDSEGLASRRNVLFDDGVLQGFVYDSYAARRAGVAPTGSAVRAGFKSGPTSGCRALSLAPGATDRAALIAAIDDGILIQDVSGLHSGVNPVSGDFSTGAEGVRIQGGQLTAPINEFTVASTLQRMLLDIDAVGSDLTFLPMSSAGLSLVVRDVTVSGQ